MVGGDASTSRTWPTALAKPGEIAAEARLSHDSTNDAYSCVCTFAISCHLSSYLSWE